MINSGNAHLAKAILFSGLFCIIFIVNILQNMIIKNYLETNESGLGAIRQDAPNHIYVFFDSIRAIAFFMLGYVFAHVAKYGSV